MFGAAEDDIQVPKDAFSVLRLRRSVLIKDLISNVASKALITSANKGDDVVQK